MTVYVLESCEGLDERDRRIVGVFSTEDKALDANAALDVGGVITEMELDEIEES